MADYQQRVLQSLRETRERGLDLLTGAWANNLDRNWFNGTSLEWVFSKFLSGSGKFDYLQYNTQHYIQLSDNIISLIFHSVNICARTNVFVNIWLVSCSRASNRVSWVLHSISFSVLWNHCMSGNWANLSVMPSKDCRRVRSIFEIL